MLLSLILCFFSCTTQSWESVDSCRSLAPSTKRDDCFSQHAVEWFQNDATTAETEIASMVQDPLILDYIWLKVTREYNPSTQHYCFKIKDSILKERCTTLVRRPHLYREK